MLRNYNHGFMAIYLSRTVLPPSPLLYSTHYSALAPPSNVDRVRWLRSGHSHIPNTVG